WEPQRVSRQIVAIHTDRAAGVRIVGIRAADPATGGVQPTEVVRELVRRDVSAARQIIPADGGAPGNVTVSGDARAVAHLHDPEVIPLARLGDAQRLHLVEDAEPLGVAVARRELERVGRRVRRMYL